MPIWIIWSPPLLMRQEKWVTTCRVAVPMCSNFDIGSLLLVLSFKTLGGSSDRIDLDGFPSCPPAAMPLRKTDGIETRRCPDSTLVASRKKQHSCSDCDSIAAESVGGSKAIGRSFKK